MVNGYSETCNNTTFLLFVAFILTTSSDRATAGLDFNLTCMLTNATRLVGIRRDGIDECIMDVNNDVCRGFLPNPNFTCICNPYIRTIVLTIPGTYDIDILHRTKWQCYSLLENIISMSVVLYVNGKYIKVKKKDTFL